MDSDVENAFRLCFFFLFANLLPREFLDHVVLIRSFWFLILKMYFDSFS